MTVPKKAGRPRTFTDRVSIMVRLDRSELDAMRAVAGDRLLNAWIRQTLVNALDMPAKAETGGCTTMAVISTPTTLAEILAERHPKPPSKPKATLRMPRAKIGSRLK